MITETQQQIEKAGIDEAYKNAIGNLLPPLIDGILEENADVELAKKYFAKGLLKVRQAYTIANEALARKDCN